MKCDLCEKQASSVAIIKILNESSNPKEIIASFEKQLCFECFTAINQIFTHELNQILQLAEQSQASIH